MAGFFYLINRINMDSHNPVRHRLFYFKSMIITFAFMVSKLSLLKRYKNADFNIKNTYLNCFAGRKLKEKQIFCPIKP